MSLTFREQDIVYADLDPREGVLLHLSTKHYFKLNASSQILWKALRLGQSTLEASQELCRHFDVSPEEALQDALTFVEKLRREHFIDAPSVLPTSSLAEAKASKAFASGGNKSLSNPG